MVYDIQKADFWKRISAFLFDFIIFGIVAAGIAWAISAIVQYDTYNDGLKSCYDRYEAEYGIKFDITTEEFEKLTDAEKMKYQEASNALQKDGEAFYFYSMTVNLTLVMIIFSILISHILLEFVVPIIFGNGQTLGKKIFGIGVVRSDGVRVTNLQMFIRTVLGKCTVETLVPVLVFAMIIMGATGILGLIILFGLALAQLILLIVTKTRTPIHDIMAATVTVDIASQMIFDTPEDLLEYKLKIQAEQAARAEY